MNSMTKDRASTSFRVRRGWCHYSSCVSYYLAIRNACCILRWPLIVQDQSTRAVSSPNAAVKPRGHSPLRHLRLTQPSCPKNCNMQYTHSPTPMNVKLSVLLIYPNSKLDCLTKSGQPIAHVAREHVLVRKLCHTLKIIPGTLLWQWIPENIFLAKFSR